MPGLLSLISEDIYFTVNKTSTNTSAKFRTLNWSVDLNLLPDIWRLHPGQSSQPPQMRDPGYLDYM